MERNYNVSGADRKALVKVIGEALGVKPKYMGTPSYAFRIGGYEVSHRGSGIHRRAGRCGARCLRSHHRVTDERNCRERTRYAPRG